MSLWLNMASPLPTLIPNIRSALFGRLDEEQRRGSGDVHFRRLQPQAAVAAADAAEDEAWKKCMEDMQASWRRDDERKSLERKARKTHAKAMKAMQTTAAVSKVMKDMKASKD